MNGKQKQTILTFAECNMNVAATARNLHYHRETIKYQLKQIKRITGLDPRNFYELTELVKRARQGEEE